MIKILKFESDSCPQCKALSTTLERISKENKIDIKNIDIEEDNNQDLIRKYNIRSIPTIIFLNEDKEYKTDMKSIDIEEDNNQNLIRKYNIRSIPTLIFLNEDQEYNRLIGNQSYATINKIIKYDTI